MEIAEIITGKEYPEKVIPMIENCKKSIDIVVFDWRWYPDQIGSSIQRFNNAIVKKGNTGKQIRAITNTKEISNVLIQGNIKAKIWKSKRLLHTKLMMIDDEIAIIGSHNYTLNAFTINQEVSLIIKQKQVLEKLKLYFENLWQL